MHKYCVILAGGGGAHFWPLSREDKPKQFQPSVPEGASFLQLTYKRALSLFPKDSIYVVSLERFEDILKEQLPDIPQEQLLLEPYGRGTATSIAYAAYALLEKDPDAVMLVTPSDHIIEDSDNFTATIARAADFASETNSLITIGIVPTNPNTGFGYVQVEGGIRACSRKEPLKAKTFTEKPSAELAQVFIDSGEFLWNSGIFVWKASAILEEMRHCCPEIPKLWKGWQNNLERVYSDSPNISIDYAVLEKSSNLKVLPADFGWNDVGSFSSYYEYSHCKDADGNMTIGVRGKAFVKDTKDSIVCSINPKKLVVVRGLEKYLVIDTDDVLLISPRDEKILQDTVRELKSPEFEEFR